METEKKTTGNPNPRQNANIFSKLTFAYLFNTFIRGLKKDFTEDDLFDALPEHKSKFLGEKLEKLWNKENRKKGKLILHRALLRMFWIDFFITGLVKLLEAMVLVIVMPYSLQKLLLCFKTHDTEGAFMHMGILFAVFLLDTILAHWCTLWILHLSMKIRVACSSVIYRKALRLNQDSLSKVTVGHMVTLLSNDVNKFDQGFALAPYVLISPIQTIVGTYLLYRELGISALFGVGFLLCCIPVQMYIAKKTSVLRLKIALRTDERVRLMNEIISGIQVIKMYCWEKPFAKLIALARRKEVQAIRSQAYLKGIMYSLEIFATRTAVFITILGYVLLGHIISAEKAFAAIAIYNVLRPVATILFSYAMNCLAESHVSVNRIHSYLAHSEQKYTNYEENVMWGSCDNFNFTSEKSFEKLEQQELKKFLSECNKPNKIVLENVSARWNKDSTDVTIEDINIRITAHKLLSVIGPVGSGKTSLLNVLLKELTIVKGSFEVQGKISYAAQDPWLFSGSVRQNILFGEKYDRERYDEVVKVCALQSDFEIFPYGDKTLVGEKGNALSGGQKSRINLARCVYRQANIYLLDDPLSAVDANVGQHLYDKCIKRFLSNKICILVTHQVQYLKTSDRIITMKDGRIEMQGTYRELQKSGLDFTKLLEEYHVEEEEKKKIRSRQNSEMSDVVELDEDDGPVAEKELMGKGGVGFKSYGSYLRAGGGTFCIFMLVGIFFATQMIAYGNDNFVKFWVNWEQQYSKNNITFTNDTSEKRNNIIYTYAGLSVATIILGIVQCLFFMDFFVKSGRNLHNTTFAKLIEAKMTFFDNNPSGRILNRFSKDMSTVDDYIPIILFEVLKIAFQLFGAFILSFIVTPWLILPALFQLGVLYFLRFVYIRTSRNVKRVESIKRSPVLSHLTTSMHGLITVRAFKAQKLLIEKFDEFQDLHSSAWYLFLASSRCFGFWVDLCSILFNSISITVLITFNTGIYGGDIGLIITQFIALLNVSQWGMRQWSELENQMVSVERILEYGNIESDPKRILSGKLNESWPEEGKIEFRKVNLQYNSDEANVLQDLSFNIEPREKIGIVGRTGAGKSSTISALFQLYTLEGKIIIDGVDATKIPLHIARSKMSIIPQEPVLFSGSLRKNLDPFEEYNDETLWNALEQVKLKETVSEFQAGLNFNVSEGGTNFSVGQRQLVCLARALVRNNKILVLDEATANVDPYTDALIQKTIRNKFSQCTVLTIAHRLNTVMDSDKILVMSNGRVGEFGKPYELLQNKDGILYDLVHTSGETTAKLLEKITLDNYEKKHGTC